MSNARELTSAALLLSVSTIASRLLGFLREVVIANQLGAGVETDAYLAAFAIPDVINHFLAGGALSAALLPLFAKHLLDGDTERAWRLVSRVLTISGLVLLVALALGGIFAEPILRVVYPGFDDAQITLTARLTRIILPGPILFTFGAIINATEQARKRFMASALTGLVYNACIIIGGLLGHEHLGVEGFSWGVVAGAALGPFLIPVIFARDVLSVRPSLDFNDSDVRRFFFLATPLLLSSSLIFFDEWFQRHFASYLEAGSITWLNNARRLMLVPAAMVGQAIGQASFAFLSRMRAESSRLSGDAPPIIEGAGSADAGSAVPAKAELYRILAGVLRVTAAVSLLTAFGVWVVAGPAVQLAFQRGAYLASDAEATSQLLRILAWAVPGWSLYTVGAKALQAAERTWLSAGLGLATLVPSWFAYQALASTDGVQGLALATVVCVTTASLLVLAFIGPTYGVRPWGSLVVGLGEGLALGGIGAGAAIGVAALLPTGSAWIALSSQGAAFAMAALLLAAILPGPSGELIRKRVLRRR